MKIHSTNENHQSFRFVIINNFHKTVDLSHRWRKSDLFHWSQPAATIDGWNQHRSDLRESSTQILASHTQPPPQLMSAASQWLHIDNRLYSIREQLVDIHLEKSNRCQLTQCESWSPYRQRAVSANFTDSSRTGYVWSASRSPWAAFTSRSLP